MTDMTRHARKLPLKPWQLWLTMASVLLLLAALLAAAGASSYDNLFHLAVRHRVPLPRLNPLEVDGGLVVVILADIVLTWAGYPFAPLRWLARLLGAGTVAANVAAGWPDPAGSFLRAFAPAIIVIVTEAGRAVLLRRNEDVQRHRRRQREERELRRSNRIPAARWMLAPWPTLRLWRRMKLWRITDYRAALDMELSRLVAIEQLAEKYPQGWENTAPADLVFMLRNGVQMERALGRVADLTRPPAAEPEPPAAPQKRRSPAPARNRKPAPQKRAAAPRGGTAAKLPADFDARAEALAILADEPDIEGKILGPRVGRSERWGQDFKKNLSKAAPKGQDPEE